MVTDGDARNPISLQATDEPRGARRSGERAPTEAAKRPRGRRREERLSADDWVSAALELVMAEGISAIKLPRLCAAFGVTKGSFYWHFDDVDDLLRAMAAEWARRTRDAHDRMLELTTLHPIARIRRMTEFLVDDRHLAVERSLREWAHRDPRVGRTLAESDAHVFALMHDVFRELGFRGRDAETRAGLLVYAGIGFATGASGLPALDGDHLDRALRLMFAEPEPDAEPGDTDP